MCLQDVIGNASSDIFCLPKVVHKLALWVNQVHDDGVVHLRGGVGAEGWGQGVVRGVARGGVRGVVRGGVGGVVRWVGLEV